MRLIDADALTKVIVNERDRIQDTYGVNDEYVRCLNKYALSMVESAHTINAIPVEWLKQQYQKCEEIKNKIPITLEPNINDVAVGFKCTELIGAIDIVLNLYSGGQKEQEAR